MVPGRHDDAADPAVDLLRLLGERVDDEGIVLLDREGRVLTWPAAAAVMVGLTAAEAIGASFEQCYLPADVEARKPARDLAAARAHGRLREEGWRRRYPGGQYWGETVCCHLAGDGHQAAFCLIVRDLTARRALEVRIDAAQRMEGLGHLVHGIAHDFNNLLMIVGGCSEALLRRHDLPNEQRTVLEQIGLAAGQGTSLAAQLLAVDRRSETTPLIDLQAALSQTGQLLRRTLGHGVQIEMTPTPAPTWVRMTESDVGQIVINLAVNARDAMPGGGVLSIATTPVTLDAAAALPRGLPPGDYVRLEVADTGSGMSAEVRTRAFERFFTTKPAGRGTGLGLASVHSVVVQSGGAIDVHSAPGEGTRFTILLPMAAEAARIETAESTDPPERAREGETVLVVEDEPAVRDIVASMLRGAGYETIEVGSGREALAVRHTDSRRIDLVVTDVMIPDLSGIDLAREFAAASPATRILFMSGYTDDAMLMQGIERAEFPFLQKPFTGRMLAQKVREVLDASSASPSAVGLS